MTCRNAADIVGYTADYFATDTRSEGSTFVKLAETAPEWMRDAVYEAHDDESPNDWRYATCRHIAALIDDGYTEAFEIADQLVDIYNADLLAWLADRGSRVAYVDEARDDFGPAETVCDEIRRGQFLVIERMARILIEANEGAPDDEARDLASDEQAEPQRGEVA